MKKLLFLALLILACSHRAAAQSATNGNGAPGGSCSKGALYTDNQTGNVYSCNSSTGTGVWQLAGGGSSGILACTTTGGVAFENGTNNTLTCGAALEWLPGAGNPSGFDATNTVANTGTGPVLGGGGVADWTVNSPNSTNADTIGWSSTADVHGSGHFTGVVSGFTGTSLFDGSGTVDELAGSAAEGNSNSGGGTVTLNVGFDCGTQNGVSGVRNACFYAPDQGTGANDYAMYLAGGKAHIGALSASLPVCTDSGSNLTTTSCAIISGQANNVIPKGTTSNSITQQSSCTDNGTIFSCTEPLASSGATAGGTVCTQGSANGHATVNTITDECPAAVTAYENIRPGVSANGIITNNVAAAIDTQGFSGDTNHSATITLSASQTVGATSLCSTTFCTAGTYLITIFTNITTACTTTGTFVPWVGWTDTTGAKGAVGTTFFGNGFGTGFVASTGTLTDTSTSNFMQGSYIVHSTGAAAINYGYTTSACGSGSLVGTMYLNVVPLG